jgi:hypothetical protein
MMVMTSDNAVAMLMAFLVIIIDAYYVYMAWLDPESLRKSLIQRQEKLPPWYPLRNYALRRLQEPGWIIEIRLLSIISSIFTIILVAVVIGKLML